MNKMKNLRPFRKYLVLIFMALLACCFLASCKKKINPPDDGNNPPKEEITITTSVTTVNFDITETFKVDAYINNGENDSIVIWNSDDVSIATIDNTGTITPIGVGITYIWATYSNDNTVKSSIKVYITNDRSRLYPIEFDMDGGTWDGVVPSTYSTFTGLSSLPTPAKEGYKFIGWENSEGKIINSITSKDRGVISLTAKYSHYPTSITINTITNDLWIGKTYQLSITADKEDGGYTYKSSDDSIASVDELGLLTCNSAGRVTITATSLKNENTTATITVKVYDIPTSFTLRTDIKQINLGQRVQLKAVANPTGTYAGVTWQSFNPEIATIDESGFVTTVGAGKVTFRAISLTNENIYTDFEINVLVPASSVEIKTPEKTSLYIGESITLSAVVYPLDVSQEVTWQSSDLSIATIDENGKLVVNDRGSVTIFAISKLTAGILDKITITCLHELLNEENSDIKYILCAPGTDASTMISINYHAMSTKTFIEYTLATDPNFEDALTFVPDGVYFEEIDPILSGAFPARNVFSAEIGGLTPNTEYIYRINGGDGTLSETYHFKTAKGTSENFSFVWLTDNHYNAIYEGAETSEITIQKAMEMREEISFVFDTGDMIDTGGNSAIWDIMFEKRKTLQLLPLVSTTGNHELYVNSTGQWDNRFHTAYNALPKNGVTEQKGTSCYFYYNDVLFIIIENVSSRGYNDQLEWMENLLRSAREENKAKMIIVGMHAPIQSEDKSNSKNDRDVTMMTLFEKYGVELVLTGHYHTHRVDRNYFEGKVSGDSLLGVNYMMGNPAGAKGAGNDADLTQFAKGYIVDVVGTSITVTQINARGDILNSYTFNSLCYEEMSEEAKNASKEDILLSLDYSYDLTLGTASFNWSSLAYGNVEKIKFTEINRNKSSKEVYILSTSYVKTTLEGIYDQYDSLINVDFYFKDGTIRTLQVPIGLSTNINIKASPNNENNTIALTFDELNSNIKYVVKKLEIYVDNKLVASIPYSAAVGFSTSYIIENIDPSTAQIITIRGVDSEGGIILSQSIELNQN